MSAMMRRRALAGLAALPALALARPAAAAWEPDPRNTLDLVTDFGAVHGQDARAALVAAIPQLAGARKTLNVPPGQFPVSGSVPPLPDNARIVGDPARSYLWPSFDGAPLLTLGAFGKVLGVGVNWGGSGTRLAPAVHIPATAQGAEVAHLRTNGMPAVESLAPSVDVHDCTAGFSTAHPGAGYTFAGQSISSRLRDCSVTGAAHLAGPAAGIRVLAGSVTISNPTAIHCARGLEVMPGPTQVVASLGVHADGPDLGGFDQCWDTGAYFATVGGVIARSRIWGAWVGGCHYGIVAWGVIAGLDLGMLDVYGCDEGLLAGPTQDLWMRDSRVAANGIGLHVASLGHLRVRGSRIGATGGLWGNGANTVVDPGGVLDMPPALNEVG